MEGSVHAHGRTGHSRGPDKRWESLIRAEFQKSTYGVLRCISCQVHDGMITLSGSVPSYYLKQVAQRLALNAVESTAVMANQLTVES